MTPSLIQWGASACAMALTLKTSGVNVTGTALGCANAMITFVFARDCLRVINYRDDKNENSNNWEKRAKQIIPSIVLTMIRIGTNYSTSSLCSHLSLKHNFFIDVVSLFVVIVAVRITNTSGKFYIKAFTSIPSSSFYNRTCFLICSGTVAGYQYFSKV